MQCLIHMKVIESMAISAERKQADIERIMSASKSKEERREADVERIMSESVEEEFIENFHKSQELLEDIAQKYEDGSYPILENGSEIIAKAQESYLEAAEKIADYYGYELYPIEENSETPEYLEKKKAFLERAQGLKKDDEQTSSKETRESLSELSNSKNPEKISENSLSDRELKEIQIKQDMGIYNGPEIVAEVSSPTITFDWALAGKIGGIVSLTVFTIILAVLVVKKAFPLIKRRYIASREHTNNTARKNNIITAVITILLSPLPSMIALWLYFSFCNLIGEVYGNRKVIELLDIGSMAVPVLIFGIVLILLCYVIKSRYKIKYYCFALAFAFSGVIVLLWNQGVLNLVESLSNLDYREAAPTYIFLGTVCSLSYLFFIPFGMFIDLLLTKKSHDDNEISTKESFDLHNTESSETAIIEKIKKQPKEKKPRDYRISEKQAARKKIAVKALIWLLYITIYSVLQTAIGMYAGNIGSIGTFVLFGLTMLFAKLHCKSYDERFHEKWTVISDTKEDTNTSQEAN